MMDMDNKIKQALEARRISPSASSWDKLANELDQKKNKPRKTMRWLRIAAVFLGGIVIGALVFNQEENTLDKNIQVVTENSDIPSKEVPAEETKELFLAPKRENTTTAITLADHKEPTKKSTPKNEERSRRYPNSLQKNSEKENKTEMSNRAITSQDEEKANVNQQEETLNEPVQNQAIADVSDAEIERLLREATIEIERQAFFNRPKNDVSAQALLQETEKELKRPYKDRVFDYVQDKLIQLSSTSRIFN